VKEGRLGFWRESNPHHRVPSAEETMAQFFALNPDKKAAFDARVAEHNASIARKSQAEAAIARTQRAIQSAQADLDAKTAEIQALRKKVLGKKAAQAKADQLEQELPAIRQSIADSQAALAEQKQNLGAIVSYIPVGAIASKVGRKRTILTGILILGTAFGLGSLVTAGTPPIVMSVLFALAGIGWATINVNSYPMVVELARGSDVGRYTGYYYTASMAAQTLTPVLSGVLLDWNMRSLFPYGCVFVLLAFATMLGVRHGDSRPAAAKGLEALDVDGD